MMTALERYLVDCEGKRRRRRDRPSDEVLGEIRRLLAQLENARQGRRSPQPSEAPDSDLPTPN